MMKKSKYDPEKVAEEFVKCRQDPFYFITNYARDFSMPDYPQIKKIHPKQEKIIERFLTDHYVIIMGSRQTGKTFAVDLLFSWLLLFYPNYKAAVLSKKGESTFALVEEIKLSLSLLLPPFTLEFNSHSSAKGDTLKNIERHFKLKNNSEVKAITVPADAPEEAGRGARVGAIFIDEAAYVKNADDIMRGMEGTTNRIFLNYEKLNYPYGVILASTPNGTTGMGQYYYNQWTLAETNQSKYKSVYFHWSEVPEYTQEWYTQKTKGLDPRTVAQEYDLMFLGSTTSYFADETIRQFQNITGDVVPKKHLLVDGLEFNEFVPFNPQHKYIIGVDSATLTGHDLSAIEVLDFDASEQVAEFLGKCSIQDLCFLVEQVVDLYPNCVIVPEANGLGNQVIEYTRQSQKLRSITFKQKFVDVNTNKQSFKFGLTLTKDVRLMLFESLYSFITENPSRIKSRALKLQLIGLENKNGRIEGTPDDGVLALGFTIYVRDKFPNMINISLQKEEEALNQVTALFQQRYKSSNNEMGYPENINEQIQNKYLLSGDTSSNEKSLPLFNSFVNTFFKK